MTIDIEAIRAEAARLTATRGPGLVAADERERVSRLHEFVATVVPQLCEALEKAMGWADKWRAKAEELAACACRIIEERDAARTLNAEATAMMRKLRNSGSPGSHWDAAEVEQFDALLAKLEAAR